jgi:hypothetical protein
MSNERSWGKNRTYKKAAVQWFAAALMVLLAVFMGASSAFASTTDTAQAGIASARAFSAVPDITIEDCSSSNRTWVHITTEQAGTMCFGGLGTAYFQGNVLVSFCPGNNRGEFWYSDIDGNEHHFAFEPGGGTLEFMAYADALELQITGWEGSYKC